MIYETMNGFSALAGVFFGVFLVVGILAYVYMALVFMTLAKKLGYDKPWLAWIPLVSLVLLPILADKEWYLVFLLLIPFVNVVFGILWLWRIYEKRKYPGWLSLLPLGAMVPFLGGLFTLAHVIVLGIVAWVDST